MVPCVVVVGKAAGVVGVVARGRAADAVAAVVVINWTVLVVERVDVAAFACGPEVLGRAPSGATG